MDKAKDRPEVMTAVGPARIIVPSRSRCDGSGKEDESAASACDGSDGLLLSKQRRCTFGPRLRRRVRVARRGDQLLGHSKGVWRSRDDYQSLGLR